MSERQASDEQGRPGGRTRGTSPGSPVTAAPGGASIAPAAERAQPALGSLRRLARQASQATAAAQERCDLCGDVIPPEHRHLMEVATREMKCVCRACSILFHQRTASEGRYLLVPDRRLYLPDFAMSDALWERLRIPVGIAFLFFSSPAQRVVAFYPSPMGPTESLLELPAWEELLGANALLGTMAQDVEALLVNRARVPARSGRDGGGEHYLVPIDECYRLVGVIRTCWRGLTGGQQVWREVQGFFEALRGRSKVVSQGALDRVGAPAAACE